ncbi:threonine transporter RhtB [Marinobacterium nitratireducens]|uniref:Threonine transporter RhtB n=1 Tax=Marinobacterium nitratireducens TaxID=518897 RepID=A0A918DW04_9GAMM|nr:LysE family translocator [Marinobacterium nitratireducens]GGO85860.1 threonine transporter RhtB [Marinobacterium nitratireducens]
MAELSTWLPAILALTLLSLSPGVDTLLTVRNAARSGVAGGVITSFGICCGLFAHALLSSLGISVVVLQSAWLFEGLRLAGAGYLIWLGWGSLRQVRNSRNGQLAAVAETRPAQISGWRCWREGLLSNLLNPKTIIFYMAFLPQFVDPEGNVLLQSLVLAAVHFVIAMTWQSLLAILTCRVQGWVRMPRLRALCHGMTGLVMIGLGLRLAMARL